jgi:hypothetical protein
VLTVVAKGCAAVPAANTRTEIRQHGGGIDTGGAGNTGNRRKQEKKKKACCR